MKYRAKIEELEREILNNYEHILELEREDLTYGIPDCRILKSPVITMKAPNVGTGSQFLKKSRIFPFANNFFPRKISEHSRFRTLSLSVNIINHTSSKMYRLPVISKIDNSFFRFINHNLPSA